MQESMRKRVHYFVIRCHDGPCTVRGIDQLAKEIFADTLLIDLSLFRQIQQHYPQSAIMLWCDGSGRVATTSTQPLAGAPLCEWRQGEDPNAAMRAYLDAQPPRWGWPRPDERTPVDTPCWVRNVGSRWEQRHFAGIVAGRVVCWLHSSNSTNGRDMVSWEQAALPDPDNPETPPPDDWQPEATL